MDSGRFSVSACTQPGCIRCWSTNLGARIGLSIKKGLCAVGLHTNRMHVLVCTQIVRRSRGVGLHTNWMHVELIYIRIRAVLRGIVYTIHHHHHHQSLNHEGRWGTTDDFATSFLHFSLFSTALWDLSNSRLVHSLMLSSHLFLCLPCLLPPFTVPCKMVLARLDELSLIHI